MTDRSDLFSWIVQRQDEARSAMLNSSDAEARYQAGRIDAFRDVLLELGDFG